MQRRWCQRQSMHASTTYAASSSRRRSRAASSFAVDTSARGRGAGPEDVGDEAQLVRLADRARRRRRRADVARRPDQFGMGVAHLVLAQPPAAELVDEVLAGEAVINLAASVPGTTQASAERLTGAPSPELNATRCTAHRARRSHRVRSSRSLIARQASHRHRRRPRSARLVAAGTTLVP